MRKILVSVIVAVMCSSACAHADVEQDIEIHRIIGGLYSLVCAVNLNDNANPHINQLRHYFVNIPDNWQNQVQLSRVKNAVWAGVSVGKYSSARKFLRKNAQALGIMDSPEGYAWLGGDYAWLKVSGLTLRAARGSGQDSGLVFLSADGSSWWMCQPVFTEAAAGEIMRGLGVKNAPELHRPAGVHDNGYDDVKPAPPQKPQEMHIGTKKSSFDMDIELGKDVIFSPIPNRRRN
ncbi:MAG: hypothetical protein IJS28_00065 [Synergistaceae bacterium]|nr:hypothetical protein [Synergistaceae bacterium]